MKRSIAALFLPSLFSLFCVAQTSTMAGHPTKEATASQKPNIILFLVDDMGWMDTSVPFGDSSMALNRRFHTPNMQKLANEGVRFTNAYANNVCTPTRTSLLTGASSARTHITNWTSPSANQPTDHKDSLLQAPAWNFNGISPVAIPNAYTITKPLPQLLKEAGYLTLHVGKAHWGSQGTPGSDPLNLGFTTNVAGSAIGGPQSYYGKKNFGNEPGSITTHAVPGLYEFYQHDIFLTEALTIKAKQLMTNAVIAGKPFFLYLGHYAVHVPLQPDKRFAGKYYAAGMDSTESAYASMIEGMDKSLGDIMDFVKKEKIGHNTIIIFMSDNGGLSHPARGGKPDTHNLPLRTGKGWLYEGGIRIPLIVKWPEVTKAGARAGQFVMPEDLFPTILQMAGLQGKVPGKAIDGISYVPVLKNGQYGDTSRALIFHFPNAWTGSKEGTIGWSSAIRQGNWKLIYQMKEKKLELYNLANDIGEQHDLSFSQPGIVKRLAALLGNELRRRGAQMPLWRATGEPVAWPDKLK